MEPLIAEAEAWLYLALALAGAVVIGLVVHAVASYVVRGVSKRVGRGAPVRKEVLARIYRPLQLLVPLLLASGAVSVAAPAFVPGAEAPLGSMLHVAIVFSVAWLLIALVMAAEEVISQQFSIEEADNLRARKIVTQTRILRRIAVIIISVLAVGVMLFEYEAFRSLGTGILASAGIIGIVVGLAAQRTIGTIIAGFQIAFTQPIRVDDVVIVEGDFGWIEEITLTYAVVRVWDQRRIIVPITHFIETPFQNWTRETSELLGTVFLYVDHRVPFAEVRDAVGRLIEASEYYDGRVWRLHVTNTSERTVEMRLLMSAKSAPELWELRCEVREQIVAHIQAHYPDALPRVRAEIRGEGPVEAPALPTPPSA
ncbi:MAG: mechanosensitive ion channel [Bacteroidetes bacterium]|jgi:small-conductance mechanosensitive channel|nr:mechanosensitive ion channel [Bacteroidota bacterium]